MQKGRKKKQVSRLAAHKKTVEGAEAACGKKVDLDLHVIARLAHDLRTPLNAIIGMLDVLRVNKHFPEQVEGFNTISSAGNHMLSLIDNLLTYAQLRAGQRALKSEAFNFRKAFEENISMFVTQLKLKKIQLLVSYPNSVPRYIISDQQILMRILQNLLSNAIKFTKRGYILVSVDTAMLSLNHAELLITVEDTGIGIAKDKIENLFGEFEQDKNKQQDLGLGLGLGLNIVKEYLHLLNAEIEVDSQLGFGSRFSCRVPVELQKREVADTVLHHSYAMARILIVDDQPKRGETMQKQLAVAGQVTSGQNVLTVLENSYEKGQPYRIIIMDSELASGDYLQLAKMIRSKPEFQDIMFVLASDELQLTSQEAEAGFHACLSKPLLPTELILSIEKAWADWEALQVKEIPKRLQISKVLLVEDDALSQKVARMMLEGFGCDVDTANDADEFKTKQHADYDLILMDVGLAGANGLELAEEIHETPGCERIPIVALTAHASLEDLTPKQHEAIKMLLTKPATMEDFKRVLVKMGKIAVLDH